MLLARNAADNEQRRHRQAVAGEVIMLEINIVIKLKELSRIEESLKEVNKVKDANPNVKIRVNIEVDNVKITA